MEQVKQILPAIKSSNPQWTPTTPQTQYCYFCYQASRNNVKGILKLILVLFLCVYLMKTCHWFNK